MAGKRLDGQQILMVIAPQQFRDEELTEPRDLFEGEGARVTVASTKVGTARGMLGAAVQADMTIDEAPSEDYQAVVIVGGMGSPDHLWDNQALHKLIEALYSHKKVVAAICLSGAVLARAGVLAGKKATVWPDEAAIKALTDGGAHYLKDHLVQDGTIITADGPEAAADFGSRIVEELAKVSFKV